mgnify:CR=1 FL=1
MNTSTRLTTLIICFLLLLTAGCGAGAGSGGGSNASGTDPAASSSPTEADAVKTIQHGLGTTEIKGTPKRIVVLEWTYAEDLLALGIQPVGVADIAGYNKWVNVQPKLAANVVDVGTRQEPNLEVITGLKPDLIITAAFRAKNSYDRLKAIAPTLAFDPYPPEGSIDQYSEMEQTFKTIADVVGKRAEADKVLSDLHKSYESAKEKLKAANKEGAQFVLTQAFSNQNAAALRLFTDNSMAVQILQRIGLKNAYKSSKFEIYGYSDATVEALVSVQNANFLYVVQDSDNVFENQLKNNAVWNGLNFVKEKRTYPLGGDTWLFGGPLSAKLFVEKTVQLLTTK